MRTYKVRANSTHYYWKFKRP